MTGFLEALTQKLRDGVDRRRFLSFLIGAPAVATLPALPTPAPATHRVRLLRAPVAGFQYHHGERVQARLEEGTEIQLQRQPENRHDSRAVAVLWREAMLGFVPRRANAAIAELLDANVPLHGHIAQVSLDAPPWQRVWIEIALDVAGPLEVPPRRRCGGLTGDDLGDWRLE